MKLRFRKVSATVVLFGLLAMCLLTGCVSEVYGSPADDTSGQSDNGDPADTSRSVDVVLYFSDDQATGVVAESRTIEVTEDEEEMPLEKIAVLELLKGPKDPALRKTMPPEAELLSIKVVDGIVILDFSQEFKTGHWGGSAGETMTLESLLYTLGKISGIDKVQVLVEGEILDSLAGHYDWSEPFDVLSK
jgi:germination protein M